MENNTRHKQIAALLSRTLIRKRPPEPAADNNFAKNDSQTRTDDQHSVSTNTQTGGEK